jgi:hypothetical protein
VRSVSSSSPTAYSCRQLLANAAIAASRVASWPCVQLARRWGINVAPRSRFRNLLATDKIGTNPDASFDDAIAARLPLVLFRISAFPPFEDALSARR